MNPKIHEELSVGTTDDSSTKDDEQHVSPAIGNTNVIGSFSVIETLQFAEWIGFNYVRLNNCWVGRFSDQRNKENWKDTGELFGHWLRNCR